MSAEFSEGPIDPTWERVSLLTDLIACFNDNEQHAALRVTDGLDALTVLEGTVRPYFDGNETFYNNMPVFLLGCWAVDGCQRVALGFGAVTTSLVYEYDLAVDAERLEKLTVEDTRLDELNSHKIRRSVFDRVRSEALAKRLFDDATNFTNWHAALGLDPDLIPPKIMPNREE
jgi:hypothetical protein